MKLKNVFNWKKPNPNVKFSKLKKIHMCIFKIDFSLLKNEKMNKMHLPIMFARVPIIDCIYLFHQKFWHCTWLLMHSWSHGLEQRAEIYLRASARSSTNQKTGFDLTSKVTNFPFSLEFWILIINIKITTRAWILELKIQCQRWKTAYVYSS